MGQYLSKVYDYFNSAPKTPIDYSKGKQDKSEYFQGILPNIAYNIVKGKFVDPYFSHDMDAIFELHNPLVNEDNKEDDERKEAKKEYKQNFDEGYYYWERISNLLKDIDIKRDLKKGIAQRGLGDCYLISFLRGFLKFQPEKFYKLLGKCHPEIGYWEVNFIIENKNKIVFVDDYIVLTKDFQPLFAGLRIDNKFAVGIALIIEKAYAKLNGSYMNIEGNYQNFDSYYYFTGLPSSTELIQELDEDEIYYSVGEYLKTKNVVTCGTKDFKEFPIKGVSKNHSYLITGKEIKKKEKILEINNPWGHNKEEMKNFSIDLEDVEVKSYIKMFNIKEENMKSGELKIDMKSLMNYWDTLTYIKF